MRPDDPGIDSYDTAKDSGWNDLSYLAGATVNGGTNDMGCNENRGSFAYAESDWEENYRKTRNLRRHTVEQGSSTWAWPQKK